LTAKENCRFVVEDAVTCTEIDLKDRVIRKTWRLIGISYSSTYELDNHVTVQIKEKSTILEGYNITSFLVYLANKGRKILISSTDDLNEARLIQSQISEFLDGSPVKCPANMKATT
jgi:hypothetical protein